MTRRSPNPVAQPLRKMLRLALSVSLVSGTTLAGASSAMASDGTTSFALPPAIDLPALPAAEHLACPANNQLEIAPSTRSAARTVLVQRWLGLGHRSQFLSSLATDGLGHTSDSTIAQSPSQQLSTLSKPVLHTSATMGLPQLQEQSSTVIPASAEEQSGGVQESLSDMSPSEVALLQTVGAEPVDPMDLLQSLDELNDVASSTEMESSESLSMSFSDRVDEQPVNEPASREPQIVRPNHPLVLQSEKSFGSNTPTLQSLTSNATAESYGLGVPPNEMSEVSSRRSSRPEPMKIQIVGQTENNSSQSQRAPLVAMLAGYPMSQSFEKPSDQAEALQQLLQSEQNLQVPSQLVPDGVDQESDGVVQETNSTVHEDATASTSEPSATAGTVQPEATMVETNHHFMVGPRASIQLTSIHSIVGVSVEREEICQLIQTGPRNYSVIGVSEGTTRIALITESSGQRQIEIQQVTVDNRGAAGSDLAALADSISHTIRQLYPYNRVLVETQGRQLVVSGKVDSEESARKILSLVRKTALTPVVDQLTTY